MLLNPPNRQPGAINRGGLRNARRTAPAPATIASFYGVGLGQVPMHLDPAAAVMSGADVVSVPNSGGAGALFNATKAGTGSITRDGNLLQIGAAGPYFGLATAADVYGTRVFFVASLNIAIANFPRFLGSVTHNTLARMDDDTGQFLFQRDGISRPFTGVAPGTALHLFEIAMEAGVASLWVDRTQVGSAAVPWTDFRADRLLAANTDLNTFVGAVGDLVSLIVDGTGNQAAQIATIRNVLAAKHGITLA